MRMQIFGGPSTRTGAYTDRHRFHENPAAVRVEVEKNSTPV